MIDVQKNIYTIYTLGWSQDPDLGKNNLYTLKKEF